MAELETVEICNPRLFTEKLIINKADYDPNLHILWAEREERLHPKAEPPPAAPAAPAARPMAARGMSAEPVDKTQDKK